MAVGYLVPEKAQKLIQKVRKVKNRKRNRKKSDDRHLKIIITKIIIQTTVINQMIEGTIRNTIPNMTHAMTIPNIMILMSHRKALMFKF